MHNVRAEDTSSGLHFRSDRVTIINGQFFFATREGTLEGPFFTRTDAQNHVKQYVHYQQLAKAMRERSAQP